MNWQSEKNDKFVPLMGKFTCIGDGYLVFGTGDDNFTLNGEPMEKNKTYYLKDGDVIEDLNFKPPTADDLKWRF